MPAPLTIGTSVGASSLMADQPTLQDGLAATQEALRQKRLALAQTNRDLGLPAVGSPTAPGAGYGSALSNT